MKCAPNQRKHREHQQKPRDLGIVAAADESLANVNRNMVEIGVRKADQIDSKTSNFKIHTKDAPITLRAPREKFIKKYNPLFEGVSSTTIVYKLQNYKNGYTIHTQKTPNMIYNV